MMVWRWMMAMGDMHSIFSSGNTSSSSIGYGHKIEGREMLFALLLHRHLWLWYCLLIHVLCVCNVHVRVHDVRASNQMLPCTYEIIIINYKIHWHSLEIIMISCYDSHCKFCMACFSSAKTTMAAAHCTMHTTYNWKYTQTHRCEWSVCLCMRIDYYAPRIVVDGVSCSLYIGLGITLHLHKIAVSIRGEDRRLRKRK